MNQTYVSLVSACTALIATIVGPYVTIRSARLQAYASALPNIRAKWIDGLRDLISTAVSQTTAYRILRAAVSDRDRSAIARNPALLARVEQNTQTITKIRLMLNPDEPDARRLVETLEAALTALRSTEPLQQVDERVNASIEQAARLCQATLKQERLRVERGV